MLSIRSAVLFVAGVTATSVTRAAPLNPGTCGGVDIFYTGLPPYHPLITAQGHTDPDKIAQSLRQGPCDLVKAGYNVQVVWAGPEIPISVLADRVKKTHATGVNFDLAAIGMGIRGSQVEELVKRFEDLIDFYKTTLPHTFSVFNYNAETMPWSAQHRMPMNEDCAAVGKPGRLISYEEICDSRCAQNTTTPTGTVKRYNLVCS